MYLTGEEIIDNPVVLGGGVPPPGVSHHHSRSIDVKDRLNRFTSVPDNIWNNPYRTSAKSHKFYH